MIKVNVILNNLIWKNYLKKSNNYINKQIKKLNSKKINYKKNNFTFSLLSDGVEIKKLNKKFRKKQNQLISCLFHFQQKKELNK